MESVGVIVPTYGQQPGWVKMAHRAMASAQAQTRLPDSVIWIHSGTLQHARNQGAGAAEVDWLIFLDADDELDPHYVASMLEGSGDIRRPSIRNIYEDGSEDEPIMLPSRNVRSANSIVIGAMCRRDIFLRVGGFDDYSSLEDWALWRKMVRVGAIVADVPEAVYCIHVRDGSRNSDPEQQETYMKIMKDIPL